MPGEPTIPVVEDEPTQRHLLVDCLARQGFKAIGVTGGAGLLKLFADNRNRPPARDWLLEAISHREADSFDRAIDLRATRLRRKIEHDPAQPETIRTLRGIGYLFVPGEG